MPRDLFIEEDLFREKQRPDEDLFPDFNPPQKPTSQGAKNHGNEEERSKEEKQQASE